MRVRTPVHAMVVAISTLGAPRAPTADCDGNGIDDAVELAARTASDCDGDGVLDTCELTRPSPSIVPHGSSKLPLDGREIEIADVNGDGHEDAAVLADSALMVLRGGGGLRLESPVVTGLEPGQRDMAAGDIEGDGDVDLVTAALEHVNVISNDGTGAYETSGRVLIGSGPLRILLAHLDGDRFLDVVTSNVEENVSVLRGVGDGSFSPAANYFGRGSSGLTAFDAEGDGDLDLGVVDHDGFSILANDGRAVLSPPVHAGGCGGRGLRAASVGDLDGDGDIDLVLVCLPNLEVSLNEKGSFAEPVRYAVAEIYSLDLLDLDGDRDLDVLANTLGSFTGFRNDGRGGFQPFEESLGPGGANLRFGDLDGDGTPEILAGGTIGSFDPWFLLTVHDLRSSGRDCNRNGVPDDCEQDCDANGIPDSCDVDVFDCDLDGEVDSCGPDANRNRIPDACEAARGEIPDCNGNGIIDELEPDDWNENGVPDGCDLASGTDGDCDGNGIADGGDSRPTLSFHSPRGYRLLCGGSAGHAALDLEPDGLVDLVTLDCDGLHVLRNRGARGLVDRWFEPVEPHFGDFLASADLDGDGRPELITVAEVPRESGFFTARLLASDPEGNVRAMDSAEVSRRLVTWQGSSHAEYLYGLGAGDLFGDARGEAVLLTERRLVILEWRGPGKGFLETPLVENFDYFDSSMRVVIRDTDGDADLDIDLGRFICENRGGFFLEEDLSPPLDSDAVPPLDLDGDGLLETVEAASGRLVVHPGKLEGSGEPRVYRGGPPRAADLDGDGDLELVALDWAFDDAVLVFDDGGAGLGEKTRIFPEAGGLISAGAADLDGDGDAEVLARSDRGSFAVWNDGWSFGRAPEPLDLPLSGLRLDVNGDGEPEWLAEDGTTTRVLDRKGALSFTVRATIPGSLVGSLDLESDGDLDLASREGNAVRLWRNDGLGAFSDAGRVALPGGLAAAEIADLDGDGDGDLVLSLPGCSVCDDDGDVCCDPELVILANREGRFEEELIRRPLDYIARDLAAKDLDLDGDVDLAVAQTDDERFGDDIDRETVFGEWIEVFVNRGAGVFEPWGALPCDEGPGIVLAEDMDGDGYPEVIVHGILDSITVIGNDTVGPTLHDGNGDGTFDECEGKAFRRGDWNGDGKLDITDPVSLLGHLFLGEAVAACADAGDADDGGRLDLTDAVLVLDYLFRGGAPPASPFPSCGSDTTPDGLGCEPAAPCS